MKELVREFGGQKVRMVIIQGEPWLVGRDVCSVLGYANDSDAMTRHCKGVVKRYPLETAGGVQEVRVLSEPDVYRLIVSSKLPSAEKFERWVFEEVLPSIRKTGKYEISAQARKDSAAARNSLTAQWLAHGADKFYHYINLTRAEYLALFGDGGRKKENMSAEEIAALRLFESLEYMKLSALKDIEGYPELRASIESTGKLLPGIRAELINGRAS